MVDYLKSTGSTGTMMIRDTGTVVEFWLKASSYTYNYQLPWGYTINGVTNNSKTFSFQPSGSWQKLGGWTVTEDQTVTFRLFDSGTSGLGGPTYFSKAIERSSRPDRPYAPIEEVIENTSIAYRISERSNNGATVTSRQISYGTSSNATGTVVSSDGTTTVTGLTPGTKYYAKCRVYNEKGWSDWSSISSATTDDVPDAPNQPSYSNVTQNSFDVTLTVNGNNGSSLTARRIGYGTNANNPQFFVTGGGTQSSYSLTNLPAGETIYIWGQAENKHGWSDYSPSQRVVLIAGAYVNVEGVWKKAVPYVNVGGVWKLSSPLAKIAGLWKPTK